MTALTADAVTLGFDGKDLVVLLVERANDPCRGQLALPGGFMEPGERLERTALRELEEETGVVGEHAEQLGVWDAPDRDPRGRTISVAFLVMVRLQDAQPRAASDAAAVRWLPVRRAKRLAFDHDEMLRAGLDRVSAEATTSLLGAELLPQKFTLSQLQAVQEAALGEALYRRNFRRRAQATGLLVPTGERQSGVAHRSAELFRFDRRRLRYRPSFQSVVQ